MNLERRPVSRETLSPLLHLKLRSDQTHLVAPNSVTIAQAAYEPGSYVWGLWLGEEAVGLVAMLHPKEAELVEGEDPEAALIWRLLINADHQGKGYGRQAIAFCVEQARDWGLAKLATSVVDVPDSNIGFYEAHGFRPTGARPDDEIALSRPV